MSSFQRLGHAHLYRRREAEMCMVTMQNLLLIFSFLYFLKIVSGGVLLGFRTGDREKHNTAQRNKGSDIRPQEF